MLLEDLFGPEIDLWRVLSTTLGSTSIVGLIYFGKSFIKEQINYIKMSPKEKEELKLEPYNNLNSSE